jgi:predicted transcriptional regulator
MKHTTIVLDEQVDKELTQLARTQGQSREELIRTAIDRFVQSHQQ